MKEVQICTSIPSCSAQIFFSTIYEKPDVLKAWHTSQNNNGDVTVSEWENCRRIVQFTMPLTLPNFVQSTFGVSTVSVCETQTVLWLGREEFTVTSETKVLNTPGSNRFKTTLEINVADEKQQSSNNLASCLVRYTARCVAEIPWPMAATVENLMVSSAEVSMQSFVAFAVDSIQKNSITERLAPETSSAAHILQASSHHSHKSLLKLSRNTNFYDMGDQSSAEIAEGSPKTTAFRTESAFADALENFDFSYAEIASGSHGPMHSRRPSALEAPSLYEFPSANEELAQVPESQIVSLLRTVIDSHRQLKSKLDAMSAKLDELTLTPPRHPRLCSPSCSVPIYFLFLITFLWFIAVWLHLWPVGPSSSTDGHVYLRINL